MSIAANRKLIIVEAENTTADTTKTPEITPKMSTTNNNATNIPF